MRRKLERKVERLDLIIDRVNRLDDIIAERIDQYDEIINSERLNRQLREIADERAKRLEEADLIEKG